ncbi:hypothetical protein GQ53DRAFT_149243 [Thozetella sp. PMI_491]|nr:hypothetical protein GQ53DRAFT_149243 [Thozetella sp. PMI_491]
MTPRAADSVHYQPTVTSVLVGGGSNQAVCSEMGPARNQTHHLTAVHIASLPTVCAWGGGWVLLCTILHSGFVLTYSTLPTYLVVTGTEPEPVTTSGDLIHI